MELRYLRDTDGREVDFVVLEDRKPIFAVECKLSDTRVPREIFYFRERTAIPKFTLVHGGDNQFQATDPKVAVVGAEAFLATLI
jgi:hypothetical protein